MGEQMHKKVTLQDIVDALGMENLITSIDGDTPCNAIMSMYTDPDGIKAGAREIKGIAFNSKKTAQDFLFVCKGAEFKEAYIEEAIANGATCYVWEDANEREKATLRCDSSDAKPHTFSDCIEIRVSDVRKAMPVIAKAYYGNLCESIKMLGVTGTKGKSSTVYFIRSILDEYMRATGGKKTAVCSGIENYDGVIEEESHLTTPEIMELYQHMSNAVSSGIKYLSMEVSSQALKYGRVDGITYEAGAFLNIGTDHISNVEHADFNDYLDSKLMFFAQCRKAAINLDCAEQDRIRKAAEEYQNYNAELEWNAAPAAEMPIDETQEETQEPTKGPFVPFEVNSCYVIFISCSHIFIIGYS
jgi:UDP-N-acetylmuramyl tripeptide synthase